MKSIFIEFRGEKEVEIEFDSYEFDPETNYESIDFRFCDGREVDLTEEEDREISNKCIAAHIENYLREYNF